MINDITKTSRDKLTASEAIFGFCGWLTTRSEITRMGSSENCAGIPDLITQFLWENDLDLPRDGWENNLIHPSGECSFGNDDLEESNINFMQLANDIGKINMDDCFITNSSCEILLNGESEYDYCRDYCVIESLYDEPIPEIPMNGKIDGKDIPFDPSVVDLHQTMDAQVWASEFCSVFEEIYGHKIDDEWMHSWFANSIMCGYDHQSWKRDKEYIYILKTCGGDILKVFHWEPSEKDIREEYVKHYPEDLVGKEYNIWDYIRLFRWCRSYGLTEINGPKSDTQYDWKAVNQ